MNQLGIYILKVLRKLYTKIYGKPQFYSTDDAETDAYKASEIIYQILKREEPSMIARFGATELNLLMNYLNIKEGEKNIYRFIRGDIHPWWWDGKRIKQLKNWSGFFPLEEAYLSRFCELMLADLEELDVLGSWLFAESNFKEILKNVQKVKLVLIEPYMSKIPWSRVLKGKRVLVIHPFAKLIEHQYEKRELLFNDKSVLPEFELEVIPAVQSLGGESCGFKDWFEALQWMKDEIDKKEYDICLIGAGAYGFPLAAHVKRQGKKSVHLGGALQLLFGIKGSRWENPHYPKQWGLDDNFYLNLLNNKHWVRPPKKYKPNNANQVEGATYW